MFKFLKDKKECKQLDCIIMRIESNMQNNYKDSAQEALKEFEKALSDMISQGTLKDKQRVQYETRLMEYKKKMEKFTHKDQTPYWN